MEMFVKDSLREQMKHLMSQDADDEGDMEDVMAKHRVRLDEAFQAAGGVSTKPKKPKSKLLPRPANWDSDEHGEWEDSLQAWVSSDEEPPVPASRRGKSALVGSDDDASVVSAPAAKTRKTPAKKAPAKPRAPAKAKAPAKATGRGKKNVAEPSDDEDDDLIMMDAPPAPKSQPKRAAAAKGRRTQTVLNFSQSQAKPSTARELSDDEISDDDDAFEPAASSSRRR
jgi:double-strand break repair protein MRE11